MRRYGQQAWEEGGDISAWFGQGSGLDLREGYGGRCGVGSALTAETG